MNFFDAPTKTWYIWRPKKRHAPLTAHNFDPLGILLLNFWEDESQLVLYLIAKLCPNLKFGGKWQCFSNFISLKNPDAYWYWIKRLIRFEVMTLCWHLYADIDHHEWSCPDRPLTISLCLCLVDIRCNPVFKYCMVLNSYVCCSTVERSIFSKLIHTFLYHKILVTQSMAVTHDRGSFPKV